ncbi:MAG: hypothetical protein JO034_15580 [Singulisphaera sp.]|nr:hypothetical protein [Singulisphaera sp.]
MSAPERDRRPRASSMVGIDPNNPYAQLGVSPLESTETIRRVGNERIKELRRQLKSRSTQTFSEVEAEIVRIQGILDAIATPRRRIEYDQSNPQNVLLTVQASPHDRWLNPRHRTGLVTAWLREQLGPDALLPSPESLRLGAPAGLAPEVVAAARHARTPGREGGEARGEVPELSGAGPDPGRSSDLALTIEELRQLGTQAVDRDPTVGG